MKLIFYNRMVEKARRVFSRKKTESPKKLSDSSSGSVTDISASEMENNQVEQARRFLYNEGELVGKPFNRRSDIRIVYVDNFVGAFLFFLRLCDQRLLSYEQHAANLLCTATFPNGNGKLSFTDRITCRNKAVIAVIKIEIITLKPQISEIRFEIKH